MKNSINTNEKDITDEPTDEAFEGDYEPRFHGYHDLMRNRIREILLVSSLYDAFTLEEDSGLSEQIFGEYHDLELTSAPRVIRVSTANEALQELAVRKYDLIITMTHLIDLDPIVFGKKVKELQTNIPVVLLVTDVAELQKYHDLDKSEAIDKIFYWNGDSALFLAIIKYFEDKWNVDTDAKKGMVGVILVIEDSYRFYSMFLPLIIKEIMSQTRNLVSQGLNEHEKMLRRRARPKILLAETFEEALEIYNEYKDYILAVITDINFPKGNKIKNGAGFEFVEMIDRNIPVLMQSTHSKHALKAKERNIPFLDKNSENLLADFNSFIKNNLGFGEFIFRVPGGKEIGRASNMIEFVDLLKNVPVDSLKFHGERNHFSRWLMARGEFEFAKELRPKKTSDFNSDIEIRQHLVDSFIESIRKKQLGIITDFDQQTFEFEETVTRFGGGSLGGKGRGIAFLSVLFQKSKIVQKFEGYKIFIPNTLIIGTEEFDKFIVDNDLYKVIEANIPDHEIAMVFKASELSEELREGLKRFLGFVNYPLAVRSSSLLEDSHHQPFAGIYHTYLLPNNHKDINKRLDQLAQAVKLVYASAFYKSAKAYIQSTLHKAEEEKMGVVIQKLVGNSFGNHFYPIFSGVVKSTNFYPLPPLKRDDPIASVAFGLGKIVVDGGQVLSFSPIRPNAMPGFSTIQDILQNSQRMFYALNLKNEDFDLSKGEEVTLLDKDIANAESDGTLDMVASVYDPEDDRLRDGADHKGRKVIMFAPMLKYNQFPIVNLLKELVAIGQKGMGCPVEMEFAAELNKNKTLDFYVLQIRPLLSMREHTVVAIEEKVDRKDYFVSSSKAMGNGIFDNIKDVIFIRNKIFDRANTIEIAMEIGELNKNLQNTNYILIGPGRWGSADKWLGIPVAWDQISGARVMVETPMEDIKVEPSHGSHFFHNLTSLGIPYLTVTNNPETDFVDWDWLEALPNSEEKKFVVHVQLKKPAIVKVDGRCGLGVIQKIKKI